MYNVLPPEYSYKRSLCISTGINFSLLLVLFSTHGTMSLNHASVSPTHITTISIQKYRVLHSAKPMPTTTETKTVEAVEKKEETIAQKRDIVQNTISKEAHKKSMPVEKLKQQTADAQQKSEIKPQPPVNKTEEAQIPQPSAQIQDNIIQDPDSVPVTSASHFGMNNEPPTYPIISFQLGEYGNVVIEYTVSESGTIKEAKVVQSSGHLRLDKAALLEFQQWKFKPSLNATGMAVNSKPQKITFAFDIKTQEIKAE